MPTFSYTAYNQPALLDVCERQARQVVAQQDGRVDKDAAGKEWFVIPRAAAKPGAYLPTWQAGPVAVDLAPYSGKTVTVELVNQPDGWANEAVYWGGREVKNTQR